MSLDNPFFSWTEQQCLSKIAEIQERIALNAQSISHAGSGSVTQADTKRDFALIRYLRQRLNEINPTAYAMPSPGLKRWRFAPSVMSE